MIPSLVELTTKVEKECPIWPMEIHHAVALIAQAAHEDYEEWLRTGGRPVFILPTNPNDADSVTTLAARYLLREATFHAKR